ncbi:MAG TPA: TolC family protein [Candidatus Acidoferrum sp.]|jgi:cobalt-zinc-cadmium efflux system outer membrane protein|nr:TolC family protein [Candidatus Acidoferrum sp.]
MKCSTRSLGTLFAALVAAIYGSAQQTPERQEPEHQHQTLAQKPAPDQSKQDMQHDEHQMNMPTIRPVFPRMGKAQEEAKGSLITLASLQQLAADSNPTLRQAEAEIRAAKARQQQSGLYPNPTVAYTGDEIRGGSIGGGKQGFFVSQSIVTASKLGKNRKIFGEEVRLSEIEAEEQKMRVENSVSIGFYRVLAAQEMLDAKRDLARIAEDNAETEGRLRNTGQADDSEVLQAEVEARRMLVAARVQESTLRQEWRALVSLVGKPELPLQVVEGNLEANLPQLNEEQVIEAIAKESPAVRIAAISTSRAQALLERAKAEPVPDLQLRAGAEYFGEQLEGINRSIGWEGIAEVGVTLPLWNRNQGNIAATRQDIDRAEKEEKRVELTLRERASSAFEQYDSARMAADEYREGILPRAKQAYSLLVDKYGKTLASYPVVLNSQKTLYELHMEYVATLENVWTTGIALQGYLLTDGLEAPARPSEVDRPVRETNVPMSRSTNPRQ